jgi:hypothetical protein
LSEHNSDSDDSNNDQNNEQYLNFGTIDYDGFLKNKKVEPIWTGKKGYYFFTAKKYFYRQKYFFKGKIVYVF